MSEPDHDHVHVLDYCYCPLSILNNFWPIGRYKRKAFLSFVHAKWGNGNLEGCTAHGYAMHREEHSVSNSITITLL